LSKKRSSISQAKWKRPLPHQAKLNVDASYHADIGTGAVGAILRDYQGNFIAASIKFIPHVSSASSAEAIVMKEGLALAIQMGCNNVQAESDSLEVFEACSGRIQMDRLPDHYRDRAGKGLNF
jgi:ribonuclease HI